MPIILRLKGLDEKAGAEDIRTFFECLHIPEGGVFIVGGSQNEAFIAFTSERDAQLAMRQSGTFLKGSRVTLRISSMEEMEYRVTSVIEKKKADSMQRKVKRTEPSLKADCPHLKERSDPRVTAELPHAPKQPPATSVQMPKQPPATSGHMSTQPPPTSVQRPAQLLPKQRPPTSGQKPTQLPHTSVQMPTELPPISGQTPTHLPPISGQMPTHLPPISLQMPTQLPYMSEQTPTELPQTLIQMPGSIGINPLESPETADLDSQTTDLRTAFLLGVCTVLQGLQGSTEGENNEAVPTMDQPVTDDTVVSNEVDSSGYVRLCGLPASATREDIDQFFTGLTVQEIIGNIKMGRAYGCLVRFASVREANEALHYDQQLLGGVCVAVRTASEKMWTTALYRPEEVFDVKEGAKPQQFPPQPSASKRRQPFARPAKRPSTDCPPHQMPKKPKPEVAVEPEASPTVEYVVKVSNLPTSMTKTQIKELLGSPKIPRQNIQHLLDKERNMTDTTFVIFNCFEDYEYAINLSGCHVGSNVIEISEVTREVMKDMLAKSCPKVKNKPQKQKSSKAKTKKERRATESPADRTCLFIRNLPADIQRSEIKSLFYQYKVKQDKVFLLYDSKGRATGEAVVQFESHKLAEKAQSLHGQTFWGTEVFLTSISVETMKELLLVSGVSA